MAATKGRSLPERVGHILYSLHLLDSLHGAQTTRSGYFFKPSDKKDNDTQYLLLIPQSLTKLVCNAVRSGSLVTLKNYSIERILLDTKEATKYVLIYLHHCGGFIISNSERSSLSNQNVLVGRLTLTQLQQTELCNDNNHTSDDVEMHKKKGFTITAKVDAISPIIAAVPSDPFALIELYQESCNSSIDAPMTAIAVLRGENALACHIGIQPGDTITLRNVRKQRWHVPSSLAKKQLKKLQFRASTHVLVVDSAQSVVLEDDIDSAKHLRIDNSGKNRIIPYPPLPSTAVPLTSLDGAIVSIQFKKSGKKKSKTVHVIELVPDENGNRVLVYLTYYPMSTNNLLGLRLGAIVRAVNVHLLSLGPTLDQLITVYGACLRSSITILKRSKDESVGLLHGVTDEDCLSTNENIAERPWKQSRICRPADCDPVTTSLDAGLTPHLFLRVQQSYRYLAFRDYVLCSWYDKCLSRLQSNPWKVSVPRLDEILDILIGESSGDSKKDKRKKNRARDPYAEFFDHAHDTFEALDSCSGECEACFSKTQACELAWPLIAGLEQIRHSCLRLIFCAVASILCPSVSPTDQGKVPLRSGIQVGWTGSMHLTSSMIARQIIESHERRSGTRLSPKEHGNINAVRLCTGGLLLPSDDDSTCSSLCDGVCRLPVYKVQHAHEDNSGSIPSASSERLGFAIVNIASSVVSCICLGAIRGSAPTANGKYAVKGVTFREVMLPPSRSKPSDSTTVNGSSSLFECGGLLFVASVQLRCASIQPVGIANKGEESKEYTASANCLGVRECLTSSYRTTSENNEAPTPVRNMAGVLTRQRFKFAKLRGDCFNECLLTLTHGAIPGSREPSAVQTIEFKLSVKVTTEKRAAVHQCIKSLVGLQRSSGITDQVNLATAWWTIADSPRSCALVTGGWDEFRCNSQMQANRYSQACCVRVQIPLTTIQKSEQGYVRVRCGLDDLRADVVAAGIGENPLAFENDSHTLEFDYIGGAKFFPGMLDRQSKRRSFDICGKRQESDRTPVIIGEMVLLPPLESGAFPVTTLCSFSSKMCSDIKNQCKVALEPSLVQLICKARLLAVTYCRARAECTRCFQPLCGPKDDKTDTTGRAGNNPLNGFVDGISMPGTAEDNTPTFWHIPLPISHKQAACDMQIQDSSPRKKTGTRTNLRCPNDCPIEYACVKWECSGIIDDGTGQAKMYSERNAALTLLGSGLAISAIEEGALKQSGGIVFSKSVPPKSYLKLAIQEAQCLALQQWEKDKHKSINEDDVLQFLTPQVRADYLLQWHCRKSTEPTRQLHFFCRCKPLSDGAFHLNQSQIELVSNRSSEETEVVALDVTSYSLPPLKLILVDCCAVNSSTTCSSWDAIKAVRW